MNSGTILRISCCISAETLNDKHDVSELIFISFHTRSERTKENAKIFGKIFNSRKVKESDIELIRLQKWIACLQM